MDNNQSASRNQKPMNSKNDQLDEFRVKNTGKPMTTNQSRKISNDQETLKAGVQVHHYMRIGIILKK